MQLATGVGVGALAGRALQCGARDFADDTGHVPLLNPERPRLYGNTGCVSLTALMPGFAASLREAGRHLQADADMVGLVAQRALRPSACCVKPTGK